MDPATLMQAVMATGFLALINSFIAWKIGFFASKGGDFPIFPTLQRLLGAFAIYLGVQIVALPVLAKAWFSLAGEKVPLDPPALVLYSILGVLIGSGAVCLFCRDLIRPLYCGKPTEFFFGSLCWLVASPVAFFVGQSVEWVMLVGLGLRYEHQLAVQNVQQVTQAPVLLGLMLGVVIVFAPFIEELLFRGLLQSRLRKHFGLWATMVITSVIFATFHYSFSQGWSNVQLMTTLFTFSLFLCWIYERQKNLWAPLGLHVMFNIFGVLFVIYGE